MLGFLLNWLLVVSIVDSLEHSVVLLMSFSRQMNLKFIKQILSPLHSWVYRSIRLLCPHFRHELVLLRYAALDIVLIKQNFQVLLLYGEHLVSKHLFRRGSSGVVMADRWVLNEVVEQCFGAFNEIGVRWVLRHPIVELLDSQALCTIYFH